MTDSMTENVITSYEQLIGAWIFAIFLIIIACVCVYYSFKPTLKMSCYNNNEEMLVNIACSPLNNNKNREEECKNAKNALDKKKQMCSVKKPKKSLLYGILLIPIAILLIMYARCRFQIRIQSNVANMSKTQVEIPNNIDDGLGLLKKHSSILDKD
jgi:hypothetical protein